MTNHSFDIALIFPTYGSFRPLSYFFFMLTLLVYLLSIFSNVFLMLLIYFESSLHKPMYIFLCNLAVNGLIGSSTVWPKIMENLLSDTQKFSVLACRVQMYWCQFYITAAYTTFSVMAYDRYVSICKPLQYHSIMTPGRVKTLLTVANVIPLVSTFLVVYVLSRVPLCRYNIQHLFCDVMTVLNGSCGRGPLLHLYSICMIACLIGAPCIIVLISYAVILNVSLKASKDAQKKALNTCSPHLITFINFGVATLFFAIYNRYTSILPGGIYILIAADWFAIPPVLNPLIYGIRTQEIRKCFLKTVRKKERFFRRFQRIHD